MGFNIFKNLKQKYNEYTYAKMLDGKIPIFSDFGDDVYASDIVQACIRCIANEFSKLQPKHIRFYEEDKQETVKSSINRLLKFKPNELMTTSEFLEKCVWLRETTYNCFIYPTYEIINGRKVYTGFYPLRPREVAILQDEANKLFLKLTFNSGYISTIPYEDIIHWRKDFSLNEFLGGNEDGKPDHTGLLKVLKINNTITEGLDKAVKTSLSVNGVIKINTMLDDEKQELERKRFEKKIKDSTSGILALDLKGEYIPIPKANPVVVDKTVLEFVQSKILCNFGVSFPIISGDFTDEQYQAYYEKTLEPMINSLGQAFSKTLFSDRELDVGNEVIFYAQKLLFTNTKNKIAVADILGNRGALTDNQLLELFGYPPFEEGDTRHMSLNFINRDIADQYQMLKKGKEVQTKNE